MSYPGTKAQTTKPASPSIGFERLQRISTNGEASGRRSHNNCGTRRRIDYTSHMYGLALHLVLRGKEDLSYLFRVRSHTNYWLMQQQNSAMLRCNTQHKYAETKSSSSAMLCCPARLFILAWLVDGQVSKNDQRGRDHVDRFIWTPRQSNLSAKIHLPKIFVKPRCKYVDQRGPANICPEAGAVKLVPLQCGKQICLSKLLCSNSTAAAHFFGWLWHTLTYYD